MKKIPDRYSKKSSLIKPVIIGSVKSFILFFLFYKSFVLSFILALIYGIINIKTYEKRRIEEWRWQMDLEFREVMTGISSALNAGYSVENSFKEAKMDLLLLYGNNSVMVKELDIINSKLMLNQPLENVLMEFARRCEVEDINNFAEVFQTAKRTGGNLIDIARSSADRKSTRLNSSHP